ncbi:GIY-YIG nuclease family protein [Slackia piriformis]
MSQEKGIVYILTNPCLDGWVKIGMSTRNDINRRLDELNRPSNIPLMFRAYAVYEVADPEMVERQIHGLIDLVDDSLHARETTASGKIREREFFSISPERAYGIFKRVAALRGDSDCLKLIDATEEQLKEDELAESSKRRPPFRFSMVDIPVGSTLVFVPDETKTCVVVDSKNHVRIPDGETTTMSRLAARLLGRPNYSFQGPKYFSYEGEVLSDRRNRFEREAGLRESDEEGEE